MYKMHSLSKLDIAYFVYINLYRIVEFYSNYRCALIPDSSGGSTLRTNIFKSTEKLFIQCLRNCYIYQHNVYAVHHFSIRTTERGLVF